MKSILLTTEQAAIVRKRNAAQRAARVDLEPVERVDGFWELPADVLLDDAHKNHWELLSQCEQVDDDVTNKRWYVEREEVPDMAPLKSGE